MGADQCTSGGLPDTCPATHCQSGGLECGSDGPPVPPITYTCPAGSTSHGNEGAMPNYYLHWDCKDTNWVPVDIYDQTEAPGGTRCTPHGE